MPTLKMLTPKIDELVRSRFYSLREHFGALEMLS